MISKEVTKIWSNLDELALKDPQKYRNYLQQLEKDARYSSRIIKPSYYLKAKGDDNKHHYLNICQSKAVEYPSDPSNIPTLMSEKREWKDAFVYDAVFNEKVLKDQSLKQQLQDLAIQCVFELFGVKLLSNSFEIVNDEYYGPYGWDDKLGKPKTSKEALETAEENFDKYMKQAQHLVFGETNQPLQEIKVHEPEEEISKNLKMPNDSVVNRPVIEELHSEPVFNHRENSDFLILSAILPGIVF